MPLIVVEINLYPTTHSRLNLDLLITKMGMDHFVYLLPLGLILEFIRELPWWYIRYESACQCREYGFDPWFGKIPHAPGQLSSSATVTEPQFRASEPQLLSLCAPGCCVCSNLQTCDEEPEHYPARGEPLLTTTSEKLSTSNEKAGA